MKLDRNPDRRRRRDRAERLYRFCRAEGGARPKAPFQLSDAEWRKRLSPGLMPCCARL